MNHVALSLKHKPYQEHWRDLATYWNISPGVRLRLEWMIFYYTVSNKNASCTARHFGISRKTFHKYLKRFNPDRIQSLEEDSRAPHQKRTWMVTKEEEASIITIRKKHMKWGKEKLKREYQRQCGISISTNKIQKVINKHQLFPDPDRQKDRVKQARKRRNKTLIHTFPKKRELGFLWHTDAVIIRWYGVRRVIFTAIEEITKIGYARVYTTNSSKNATDFLTRLLYLSNNQVKHIHHDNGSEFYGAFEEACQSLRIHQIFSRVRTPTDNAALERFNWTLQDEWLSLSEVGLDDIQEANQDLTDWLIEYNKDRPHQSLDYQTPIGYATQTFNVSPMWASRTPSLPSALY